MDKNIEILDIVDDRDIVIGSAPYPDVYKKSLHHRIVHILIYNSEGKMALQMRSKHKTFCPQHWCTAAGGHVQSGESYETAALRELEEEIGIKIPLEFLFKELYVNPAVPKKFLGVFKATFDGKLEINQEEVERVEYFTNEEIEKMINNGEKFHPELLFILKKLNF